MLPLALALLPTLTATPPSAAAPPGKTSTSSASERLLVLVVPPAAEQPPRTLAPALEAALRGVGLDVVDVDALFPARPSGAPEGAGAKLLAEGKAAYDNLDIEPAGELFAKALEQYTANASEGTSAALAEVHMLLAAVALQGGTNQGPKRAQSELERALRYAPELTLSPQYFGADGPRLLAKAKAAVAGAGQGRLKVRSTPPARATLGGQELASEASVPRGRHLVEFTLPGHVPKAVFVDVGASGAQVSAVLTPRPGYDKVLEALGPLVPSSFDGAALPAAAAEAGKAVGARFLVLVSADGEAGVAEVWDLRAGDRLTGLELPAEALAAPAPPPLAPVAEKVKSFVRRPSAIAMAGTKSGGAGGTSGAGVAQAGSPASGGAGGPREPIAAAPASNRWWIWGIAGAAAVAGGLAVGVAVAASDRGRPFNPVLGY